MEMTKKRLLITGISGLLGNNLAFALKDHFQIEGWFHAHPVNIPGIVTKQVDITHLPSLQKALDSFSPDIAIHCAAETNIDSCEYNQSLAKSVNVDGTKHVVNALKGKPTKLIYTSTDAVFGGQKGNYKEDDPIEPHSFYAQTKYQGELEVLKRPHSLVARINIFGWNCQDKLSLAEWILSELSQKRKINGFTDVFFSSIYTLRLAELFHKAILKDLQGLYHFASSNFMSKYNFAIKIAKIFDLDCSLIEPISVDNFIFKARRSKNLSLDVAKLSKDLKSPLFTMEDSIQAFYDDYKRGFPRQIKGKDFVVTATSCAKRKGADVS